MDIFLNFKKKTYKTKYQSDTDIYVSCILRAHVILCVFASPFTIAQYERYNFHKENHSNTSIAPFIHIPAFYASLFITAMIIQFNKKWVKNHKYMIKVAFDIFYIGSAIFLQYTFWESSSTAIIPLQNYIKGWWNMLVSILLFSNISRWYLKILAYYIIILRIGIGSYFIQKTSLTIVLVSQFLLVIGLATYFAERDSRKHFLEMQHIQEETEVMREIMDKTTDGIIIYGLQDGLLFRNSIAENYSWWNFTESFRANISQIRTQKIKEISTAFDLNIFKVPEKGSNIDLENYDLETVLNNITRVMLEKKLTNKGTHQTKNLMVVLGMLLLNDHTKRLLEIQILSLVFQEKPSLALIFRDTTDRDMVLALQDSNNYKSRLLASVSHELRTPLNASLNFTQNAIEDPDTPEHIRQDYLLPSYRSNQLLLHLINDILDFSQMADNKLRLVYESVSIQKTLDECMNLMTMQTSLKGLGLSIEYEIETSTDTISTDHNRLKQIILNLLSNALKFTLEGEIKVRAKLYRGEEDGKKRLSIEIADTGIGISEEDQKKLFKDFEKVELGDKIVLNSTGVGLGLVISNNLVLMLGPAENNNGIRVRSEIDKGTTFSFWIPDACSSDSLDLNLNNSESLSENYEKKMCEDRRDLFDQSNNTSFMTSLVQGETKIQGKLHDHTMRTQKISKSKPEVPNMKFPSVLVVDDDIFNIVALESILKKLKYSCDTSYNGKQAIQKVLDRQAQRSEQKCEQYDIILMDCGMPIMDGFEATERLKAMMRKGEIEDIPIVACTAFVQEKDRQRGEEVGMDAYCQKPLNPEKIGSLLKRFVRSHN